MLPAAVLCSAVCVVIASPGSFRTLVPLSVFSSIGGGGGVLTAALPHLALPLPDPRLIIDLEGRNVTLHCCDLLFLLLLRCFSLLSLDSCCNSLSCIQTTAVHWYYSSACRCSPYLTYLIAYSSAALHRAYLILPCIQPPLPTKPTGSMSSSIPIPTSRNKAPAHRPSSSIASFQSSGTPGSSYASSPSASSSSAGGTYSLSPNCLPTSVGKGKGKERAVGAVPPPQQQPPPRRQSLLGMILYSSLQVSGEK